MKVIIFEILNQEKNGILLYPFLIYNHCTLVVVNSKNSFHIFIINIINRFIRIIISDKLFHGCFCWLQSKIRRYGYTHHKCCQIEYEYGCSQISANSQTVRDTSVTLSNCVIIRFVLTISSSNKSNHLFDMKFHDATLNDRSTINPYIRLLYY